MKKQLLIISTLFLSVAANAQWTSQATAFTTASRGISDVCAVDANVVWVAAYDGSATADTVQDFARTTNGGTTWTSGRVTAPTGYAFENIAACDANTAWAMFYDEKVGTGGGIFKTTDGGTTWNQQGVGTIFDANSFPDFVYFANATLGIAVGDPNGGYFEIYTTTDGGTTWTRTPQANIPNPVNASEYGYNNMFDVVGTTIWFGTNQGRVYKSVDGGLHWTVATTGLTDLNHLAMSSATNGLVGLAGAISKTTDGGATWAPVTIASGTYHTADLKAVPNSSVYVSTGSATGDYGSSYTVDGGSNWVTIDAGTTSPFQHTAQAWVNTTTGWCGGFNTSATADGIFKYSAGVVGVAALNRDNARMRLYPNPSNGQFTVQIGGAETKDAMVTIVDLAGRVVYEQNIQNRSAVIEKGFDLTGISKGVYIVNVVNGTTRFSDKITIK